MSATSSISAVFNAVTGPFDSKMKLLVGGLDGVSKGAKRTNKALSALKNIQLARVFVDITRTALRAGQAIARTFDQTASSIDKSAKTARTLGLDFQQYEGLALVFKESGVEATLAEAMIAKLLRRVGEGRKGATFATKAFSAIGISIQDLAGLDTLDIFSKVIQGLKDVGDAAEQQRVAQLFFEETGARLGTVIEGGSAAFASAARRIKEYGLALRGDQVKAVEDFNNTINETKLSIRGLYNQVVSNLAPAISGVADIWNQWVKSIGVENLGKSLADQMWEAVLAAAKWYDTLELGIKDITKAIKEAADIVKQTGQVAAAPFSAGRLAGGEAALVVSSVGLALAEAEYFLGLGSKEYRDRMKADRDIAAQYAFVQRDYVNQALGLSEETAGVTKVMGGLEAELIKGRQKFVDLSKVKPEEKGIDDATKIATAISSKLASLDARSQAGVNFILAQQTVRRQTVEQQQLQVLKKIEKHTADNVMTPNRTNMIYAIP